MTFRDLIRLVLSNLRRMKARVAMTATGVVIGTASVVVLVSLGAGLQQRATESLYSFGGLTELVVYPSYDMAKMEGRGGGGGSQPQQRVVLNDKMLALFRQISNVAAVTPIEYLQGGEVRLGSQTSYISIVGVDPEAFALAAPTVVSGTLDLGRGKIVIGANVPENFINWMDYNPDMPRPTPPAVMGEMLRLVVYPFSTGDTMPTPSFVRLQVAGQLKAQGYMYDYSAFMSLKDVLDLNTRISGQRPNKDKDGYSQVIVKVDKANQVLAVEQAIKEQGFEVQSARSQLEQINSFFLVIQAILGGIGAVALLVSAFGIANTMMMSIYERTREIGLMKALGASNQDVMSVFLSEAGGIGLLGGIGGVLLGLGLGGLANLAGSSFLSGQIGQFLGGGGPGGAASTTLAHTPLWLPPFAIVFAALIGVISGVYPALRAAALSPIIALKYE